jgi:hypothetical protein
MADPTQQQGSETPRDPVGQNPTGRPRRSSAGTRRRKDKTGGTR